MRSAAKAGGTVINGWLAYDRITDKKPMHSIPIWSCYTTAYARIRLYNKLISCTPVYCDTDSIMTQDHLETGDGLGELKLENVVEHVLVVKPKVYAGVCIDGKIMCKVKGLPPARHWTFERFKEWAVNPVAEYWKFSKFRESVRRGMPFNRCYTVKKTMKLDDDKRYWQAEFSLMQSGSRPLEIIDGLTEYEHAFAMDKAMSMYNMHQKQDMDLFFKSDLFDSKSFDSDFMEKEANPVMIRTD
jgi:hypothetical protein